MALSLRQSGPLIYDDQGPGLPHAYVGSWTSGNYTSAGYYNNTATVTDSLGASFWFIFNGSKATVIGCGDTPASIINTSEAPAISLYVDNHPIGLQATVIASDGRIVSGETPQLPDGSHTVNATVVNVIDYVYCVDYFEVVTGNGSSSSPGPTATRTGTSSSPGAPGPPTPHTRNVGRIVGGSVGSGVGGIVLAALVVMCFLWGPGKGCCKRNSQGNRLTLYGEYHMNGRGERHSQPPHTDQGSNNPPISSVGQNGVDRPQSPDFSGHGLIAGDVV